MNGRIALWRIALVSAVGFSSLTPVQAEEPNQPGTESLLGHFHISDKWQVGEDLRLVSGQATIRPR